MAHSLVYFENNISARTSAMDTILSAQKSSQKSSIEEKIHAADLLSALDHYENKIKVLSLDCFDTILWRKTATPTDVFYDLQNQPAFQTLGFTSSMRVTAEINARKLKMIQHGKYEVRLNEIYHSHFPNLDKKQLQALADDELATEIATCYAFPPIIELIRKAHEKKIKIIIVSDTYLKTHELTRLLASTLPPDVMSVINIIFCSCEYGKSKRGGLFKDVIKKLNISANAILHIGDNLIADFVSPRQMKLHALHLIHHEDHIADILRMQSAAASLIDTTIRYQRSMNSPFRGVLASKKFSAQTPEQLIGYAALGPIIYSFGTYICNEIEKLKQQGKVVKTAFLMRDAYLPSLACEAITGKEIGKRIRISRFTAFAASFRTKDDIDRYLVEVVTSNRFEDIARQLLIPDDKAKTIIQLALQDLDPALKFSQLVHQEEILEIIFKESFSYRTKLKNYLDKEMALKKGDTLLFVDLGYSGTAQRLLEPVFREEFGIEIIGRYLLALAIPDWQSSRSGLLDRSNFDDRTMHALVTYIALLEQLCTSCEKSVVGYDDDGNPIFSDSNFSEEQYKKLTLIHHECIQFVNDAKQFLQDIFLPPHMLRDAAAAALSRLIYIPTETEIDYLQSFEFDLNLGTKDIFHVFNIEKGLAGLRRRGIFSSFMEKTSKSFRTNTPAELRSAGLELSLTLLAQHRFMLEFGLKDLNFRREQLTIIVMSGNESTQAVVDAQLTHDGYYALCIPLGMGNFQIGILFGQKYQWVEFESAELINMQTFLSSREAEHCEDYWQNLFFGQMENRGGKLFECTTQAGFMMINPTLNPENRDKYALRIIFRSIVTRECVRP